MKLIIEARESGTSTGRHIDKLIENLHKLKPEFEIIIHTKPHRINFFKETTPDFGVEETTSKEFTFSEQFNLARHLYSFKPDLVHFTMTHQPILYFGKSITTIHDLTTARFTNPAKNWLVFKLKQLVYRGVIVWVAHKSRSILTISDFVKQDIAGYAHIDPNKIKVTYLAADNITDKAEPVNGVTPGQFIMYVGRPLPHKNLQRLIEAFALLRTERPDLELVLAGKKDVLYERFERQVKKEGIQGVTFTDFVTEGQLRWLYENTAAYVFPSLSEGFGLPGLEAMAHGAPVVSSNATCLPEIYGEAAHYFDPTSIDDMAAKIQEVLTDKDLKAKLIKNGRTQAAKYSWQTMAEQTLEVYKKALGINT
jgi:glycosyltransferase involved in cell wall biosynthesis